MNITISGKQISVTPGMRAKIEKKLQKIDTFLPEESSVNVIVRTVKDDQIIEVTIPLKNKKFVRAEERDRDFYAAVDMVEESLVRQLRKLKDRRVDRRREKPHAEAGVQGPDFPARTKIVELTACTAEEAAQEMEMLGHMFHLFYLSEDANELIPAVVYRRNDGGVGLIRGV